jgi:hypothetical protein
VLRHATAAAAADVLHGVLTDHAGGWPLPQAAGTVVDVNYVLATAGLLAPNHPSAAANLLVRHLLNAEEILANPAPIGGAP